MRYDTPVYFQKTISGEYDPNTGNYGEDSVDETLRYASVMDTSIKTMRLIYGEIRQGSLCIQLQNHYTEDSSRKLRIKHTFVVSEVQ